MGYEKRSDLPFHGWPMLPVRPGRRAPTALWKVYTCRRNAAMRPTTSAIDRNTATLAAVTLLPMKALVISRLGDPEVLEVRSVPDPVPARGRSWSR